MSTRSGFINGVPHDRYGTWCEHGHHVFVVDPADDNEYPRTIPADPWPCGEGCTLTGFIEGFERDAAAYEEERWREYWSSQ